MPEITNTESDWVGRTLVHREMGYVFEVRAFHETGPQGPWLILYGVHGYRTWELPLSQVGAFRPQLNESRVGELERLVTQGRAAQGQGEFDLRMYVLGTPEQAAIAAATLMERVERDPTDRGSASDLSFLEMKILGELASVRMTAVRDYVQELQRRRSAVPPDERILEVPVPHLPSPPTQVMRAGELEPEGWHLASATCTAETWSLGDGLTRQGLFDFERRIPGGEGEWFTSVHQIGDERLDWVVLSQGGSGEINSSSRGYSVAVNGIDTPLERQHTLTSETGYFIWMGNAPDDAPSSVAHRMNASSNTVMVWPFGGAVSPGRDGEVDIYGAVLPNGGRVWALRIEWDGGS